MTHHPGRVPGGTPGGPRDGAPVPWVSSAEARTIVDGRVRRTTDDWYWRADGTGFPAETSVAPSRVDGHVTGARLSDGASGPNVVAEYFREGEEPIFGMAAMLDGGFAMGANLPMFAQGESDEGEARTVTTSTGKKARIAPKASFGSLSSGGLY